MSDLRKAAKDFESHVKVASNVDVKARKREYDKMRQGVDRKMSRLEKELGKHAKDQLSEPTNWGYIGDLGHVSEVLDNILEFINSGVVRPRKTAMDLLTDSDI